jgi:hypothetical protein
MKIKKGNMQFLKTMRLAAAAGLLFFTACKKSSDNVQVSKPPFQVGQAVTATYSGGPVTGTMLSGQTYTITSDVIVPQGDTLLLQSGVTMKIAAKVNIIVHGTFISLGTQAKPNWISTMTTHQDQAFPSIAAAEANDPALQGLWYGISCDTTCPLFVMKWTHLEFCGATFVTAPVAGLTAASPAWPIFYQNPNGVFVLEDSWVYGCTDDMVHITDGKVSIMRNTLEKGGGTGGDCVNLKSGTVGDVAYNLFVGDATNGSKISNAGATAIQCNVHNYNNTYIDCGYRQSDWAGHGGSIDLEKAAKALIYNNLIVNCRVGLRIVNTADTTDSQYGNSYFYGDSLSVANDFYSVGDATHPQSTDIPNPSSYLPAGYVEGAVYNGQSVVSVGNPMFTNFPLPNYNYQNVDYSAGFNFHLATGSPAIGKGYASFSALAVVPVDSNFAATAITAPGSDMGCYQSNGTGNQH